MRVSPPRRSQLATAAVCTEQHQMRVVSCSQSYLTQLIEYGEGLQHTPELERRHQKICVPCCRSLLFVQNRALYRLEPTENVVITCRLRESNFGKSSLAEFGCDARSLAGDREDCCVGGTWRGRAVSGDRVAPGSSRCWKNIL